jgi:hypothetical protein
MRDDFYGPGWADNRHHLGTTLGDGAHKLGATIMAAFESLAQHNYEAPWQAARPPAAIRHH